MITNKRTVNGDVVMDKALVPQIFKAVFDEAEVDNPYNHRWVSRYSETPYDDRYVLVITSDFVGESPYRVAAYDGEIDVWYTPDEQMIDVVLWFKSSGYERELD